MELVTTTSCPTEKKIYFNYLIKEMQLTFDYFSNNKYFFHVECDWYNE